MERKILPKNTKKGRERWKEKLYISRFGDSKTNSAKICSFYRSVIATEFYIQQEWRERTRRKGGREMERIHEY
jgi:hypothetical protein